MTGILSTQPRAQAEQPSNELEPYFNIIENNKSFKEQTSNSVFDHNFKDSSIKIVKKEENKNFNNDVAIVQGKLKNKDITIAAIFNKETKELYSYTTISIDNNETGHDIKEFNAKTGVLTLANHIDQQGNVQTHQNTNEKGVVTEVGGIEPGSYWWKVICGLSTGGSCSLGCLSLIAVPGGYPMCTLVCSAMAGGAAC
ncbi:hypothetical protein ACFP67_10300 [Mammaliicoccus sciuri]|uniref:hypothetical protein n=1 Tax=Mammaliicoccus sciuri TaxID=1296 RepID=UPI000CD2467C|nr:hypothetical protein [Mammaliicoccus sciuri]PNZ26878.1 hypothetical protein CD114_06845 [Mammaliicoccus sciuri]